MDEIDLKRVRPTKLEREEDRKELSWIGLLGGIDTPDKNPVDSTGETCYKYTFLGNN
jgi:hypothetical protein